ncbi:MAG: GHKL domain-containing protein [Oscillospiraceae bacterium]|nr:GHKL domain-containing protein [Oscillospiraceae bacterium]
MFIEKWLSAWIEFLVLIPCALSCYLPAKNKMKFSMLKTTVLCCAVLIPFSVVGACVIMAFALEINTVVLPALIVFFFIFQLTVRLDLPKTLAIYVGVCAIQTFPAQFATIADTYLKSEAEGLTVQAALIHLGLACLLAVSFIYPARNLFFRMVDQLEIPKIWYFVTALSSIFLMFNILTIPKSYDVIRESRLQYIFPIVECCALAVLVTIYVLFYRGSLIIIEHAQLEKRSQLLEIQAHQFHKLQKYMKQTARLRHDFRHSVHLLSTLADNGDLDSVRTHLSEYEQRLAESVSVQYCSNAALNALFGYYREMADSEKIRTDWKIELPESLTISELDMAALFGNILENAISACVTLPENERYFNLTTEIRHGNRLYIVSTNSFDGKVRKGKDGYYSTKHSGHGIGLISIAAAAEKYDGSAQIRNSSKEFFVDVVMKL